MLDQSLAKKDFYVLSKNIRKAIEHEKYKYEDPRAASIEALKIIQKEYGWVADKALHAIAEILNVSVADLESIATFYSQIFRESVGRHIIRYCNSVVCYINGYQNIQVALELKLNIKPGQTTLDNRFTLLPVCCLGNCDKGPTMMIDNNTYVHLTPQNVIQFLEYYP
ncbi:NADH-quinone oxidoreductase subunit E [Candidatus Profftia lariciata]|uniref:NADH-quinone oxidoreductase subunit NuoE n=1 Tax=Candidatus Profftia lariciata TaxID=1987921 RepID=UPI001D017432|nr:NADH-quinone oxidoreductase subunit NuoE [Candidatus Profftia lariciata]UDG81659.1 NADH-quinone oxidoreductase subunit E [Candidatus Profftia lariciata]